MKQGQYLCVAYTYIANEIYFSRTVQIYKFMGVHLNILSECSKGNVLYTF